MKSKLKLFLILTFTQIVFFLTPVYAEPASDLKQILGSINSIQANFKQRVLNKRGKIIRSLHGSMAVQRPNRFRWDIQAPFRQLIVADGQNVWIFDRDLKQVAVQKIKKGGGITPAMLLSGSGLLNNFFISSTQGWFILKPKIKSQFREVRLLFKGNALTQMQLEDSLGQTSEYAFSQIRVNAGVSPSLFKFSVPKGVDVIKTNGSKK